MSAAAAGGIANAALDALVRRGRASGQPRTNQKVWGGSRHVGEREARFWRPVDPLELRAVQEAARLEAIATKQPGKRNGKLGHVALEVLALMVERIDWATGALEDAYVWMAKRLNRCKDAIWRALAELREGGWLEWINRSEPTADGARQVENAYRILVPARWAKRVTMRIEQWRRRAKAAGQLFRDHEADRAARAARREKERLANARRYYEETIADPELRAACIADIEAEPARATPPPNQSPSPPNGKTSAPGSKI